jgi:predicted TIM-barrel fold metal-dependent hydrolase
MVSNPQALANAVTIIERYPDRILFGTDEVAPRDRAQYMTVYEMYAPLWARLSPAAREKVTRTNYERLFDSGRARVRAWEQANIE